MPSSTYPLSLAMMATTPSSSVSLIPSLVMIATEKTTASMGLRSISTILAFRSDFFKGGFSFLSTPCLCLLYSSLAEMFASAQYLNLDGRRYWQLVCFLSYLITDILLHLLAFYANPLPFFYFFIKRSFVCFLTNLITTTFNIKSALS